jgi:glycosyltransferase involved in cell wall biosynthesis
MPGRVPFAEVTDYYDLVDVFVYPRLKMRLTDLVTPLKPIEAMASGRIVVASDVGGHREIVTDGETGFLFTAGDEEALAAVVTATLGAEARWPEIAARARRYVEQERSWRVTCARYGDVFADLRLS